MSTKIPQILEELLHFFPEISPPITVSDEAALSFSRHNKPLSASIIDKTFSNWDTFDEFTELVPCFRLPLEDPFYAFVYWKGALMSYEYILITIDEQGLFISKKVIAGTVSNGESVIKSVAVINEENLIYTSVGGLSLTKNTFNPVHSKAYKFEILPDGQIQSSQEELNTWEQNKEKTPNQKN